MTGTVSFPWIDNGKKLEVRKIPINGERELKHLLLEHSNLVTLQKNSYVFTFHQIVIEARKVLTESGVNVAKEAWESTLKKYRMFQPEFEWGYEDWTDSFLAYYEKHTLRQLKARTIEEAEAAAQAKIIEISKEIDAIDTDVMRDFEFEYQLSELYWRLRACGAKRLTPDGGEPHDLDWSRPARPQVVSIIGDFADGETIAAFRRAEGAAKPHFDIADYAEEGEESMRGKSEPTSTPSTKSSGDSPASSAPTTAQVEKLVTSETRSG